MALLEIEIFYLRLKYVDSTQLTRVPRNKPVTHLLVGSNQRISTLRYFTVLFLGNVDIIDEGKDVKGLVSKMKELGGISHFYFYTLRR